MPTNPNRFPLLKHRVVWDFAKANPGTWGATFIEKLGKNNEGEVVDNADPRAAVLDFAKRKKLNPFYLKAIPVHSEGKP